MNSREDLKIWIIVIGSMLVFVIPYNIYESEIKNMTWKWFRSKEEIQVIQSLKDEVLNECAKVDGNYVTYRNCNSWYGIKHETLSIAELHKLDGFWLAKVYTKTKLGDEKDHKIIESCRWMKKDSNIKGLQWIEVEDL